MKPNDKAIEAARAAILNAMAKRNCIIASVPFNENNTDEFDASEAIEHAKLALTAAYAAQFQSGDYAELIERLRNKVFYRNYWLEPEGDVPVLVDRDMANEEGVYSKLDNPAGQDAADAIEALLAERDALKVTNQIYQKHFSGIEDEIRLATESAIAAVRPHIEAMERERCAQIAEEGEDGSCWTASERSIAAAIRRGK